MSGDEAPREGHCRSCGAAVTWVQNTKTGKRLQINGGIGCVKVIAAGHGEVNLKVTKAHFATCRDAKMWRRRR